jgi:hypothetical protein
VERVVPAEPAPQMFAASPHLSDVVNHNIIQSEIEGGVYLPELPANASLEIQTQHHLYRLMSLQPGEVLISGHPDFCPEPVPVSILGSNWGGSMLKMSFIGRGMHLEFRHPDYARPIVTSRIREIRQIPPERLS